MLLRKPMLWAAGNATVKRFVVGNPLSRGVARRFVAGETASEAIDVVHALNRQGMFVTLDYLGENVTSAHEARAVVDMYQRVLRTIRERKLNCNISLKLTALGMDIDRDVCAKNLRDVLDVAREDDTFVRLDMEGSAYTQATLDIFEQAYADYHNVGVVLQSYLYRTAQDVERAIQLKARVRLCKGAYDEAPSIAFPEKADVDRNYIILTRRLLEEGNYPGLATHDAQIIDWVKGFVREHNIDRSRYEFQMLYGVRRDLQRQLVAEGYNMRVYVPFGEAWYPYLMRRMAERPANLLFVLRSLQNG